MNKTTLHLGLLVGLLIMVLVAMKLAANPDNWAWMGFDAPAVGPSGTDGEGSSTAGPSPGIESEHPPIEDRPSEREAAQGEAAQQQDRPGVTETAPTPLSSSDEDSSQDAASLATDWAAPDITSVSRRDFWSQVFEHLDRQQRLLFFRFIWQAAAGESDAVSSIAFGGNRDRIGEVKRLFGRIDRYRTVYHGRLLESISIEPGEAGQRKQSVSEILFELQQAWEYDVSAAFAAAFDGEPLSKKHLQDFRWLYDLWEQMAFAAVEDGSADVRDEELVALEILIRRLDQVPPSVLAKQSLGSASLAQLLSQTNFYRGQPVTIEGRLLGVRPLPLAMPLGGRDRLYELWIASRQRSVYPFCVYALALPDEYKGDLSGSVAGRPPVNLTGYVLKRRFYAAADGSAAEAPLLVSHGPEPASMLNSGARVADVGTGGRWLQPWMVAVGALLSALVACGVTRFAYRSVVRKRGEPAERSRAIDENLDQLRQRSDILTTSEKIDQLNR